MKKVSILEKIILLNQAVPQLMAEEGNLLIIKNFTENGVKIFGADFGFVWGKLDGEGNHKLLYKSEGINFSAVVPRRKNNKGEDFFFDSNVKQDNYATKVDKYLKSYISIPIKYGDHIYGNIILGYRKKRVFTLEELAFSETMGNIIAQSLTINLLIDNEQRALSLAEKQRETQVLLDQEKLKMEFISNATHEFRTPLAIMRGNVDLALGKGVRELKSAKSALRAVSTEINHLSTILADLSMLISPKKESRETLDIQNINIVSVLREVASRVRTLSQKKNISIKIKRSAPLHINADKKYIEKLFLNLFKNAVSYGRKKGRIVVDIQVEKKCAKVKVVDNGIGISEKDLPHIFERFFRADKSHSSRGKHSGLGLAISKWVAEIHNGSIEVKSVYGKGTTFIVNLPCEK